MQPSILITNGGPHPPAKWANLTAERILVIDEENITPERRPMALRLQAAIAEALMPHHAGVQDGERRRLSNGNARLADAHDGHIARLDAVIADIRAAAKGTPWEAHFAEPAVEAAIRKEVASHMIEIQKIERSWHCDLAPDKSDPHVEAYRAALVGTALPKEV